MAFEQCDIVKDTFFHLSVRVDRMPGPWEVVRVLHEIIASSPPGSPGPSGSARDRRRWHQWVAGLVVGSEPGLCDKDHWDSVSAHLTGVECGGHMIVIQNRMMSSCRSPYHHHHHRTLAPPDPTVQNARLECVSDGMQEQAVATMDSKPLRLPAAFRRDSLRQPFMRNPDVRCPIVVQPRTVV